MLETPTRATAMVMPLGDLRAWNLSVHCPACRVLRQVTVAEIIERTSAAILVRDILPKLSCKRCGTAPSWVQLWGRDARDPQGCGAFSAACCAVSRIIESIHHASS